MAQKLRKYAALSVALFALAACGQPATETTAPAETTRPGLSVETNQRVTDLVAVNNAIQAYKAQHGQYPISQNFQGYASAWGASLGDNWLPELGLASLPRDPANSTDGEGPQYLYVSNGFEYKLIAHRTGDCSAAVEVEGIRIDPARQPAPPACDAYGFWSENGAAL